MDEPTAAEQAAFLWMQGRMVELLLRYYTSRHFERTFGEQAERQGINDPRLKPYRDLAVFFYLRDALFDSILPRIKRRLSFAAPREVAVEPLPARGRIDWSRTLAATWRERPGEMPLQVQTRQRRRHFATPENLLVVGTLIEYRAAAQHLLDLESDNGHRDVVKHPLNDIVDVCTRELVFPQFAGLVSQCDEIVGGWSDTTLEDLEVAVAESLLPGHNSAYDDLLDWRRRLSKLNLLDRTPVPTADSMLGADPDRDNYLYQFWLFYELGQLLQEQQLLQSWDHVGMNLTFTWGSEGSRREYRLQHDQAIKQEQGVKYWHDAPGVRPDFYIEPVDRVSVYDGSAFIWREPGFVLDAKYYKPRSSLRAPADPVKRMVADLQLTGEQHGALLFAFQHDATVSQPIAEEDESDEPDTVSMQLQAGPLYAVKPTLALAQHIQPDLHVDVWRICPSRDAEAITLAVMLTGLLDSVHLALQTRVEVECHGVFLDTLTADGQGRLASSRGLYRRPDPAISSPENALGLLVDEPLDQLLLCPKPHVGSWRVDLVSLNYDCCSNGSVCHIKSKPGARKPQRLTALSEIESALTTGGTAGDEATVNDAATKQVLVITKRYAQLLQPNIANYRKWIRDKLDVGDVFDQTPLLTDVQRETLALGRFLWEQIEHIRASNYAGPALLLTGVLEELTRATVFKCSPPLTDKKGKKLMDTLGTLANCHWDGGANWRTLETAIVHGNHWNSQVSPVQQLSFDKWIGSLETLKNIRNDAAHRASVAPDKFEQLCLICFGSTRTGMGVMNGLLLAWIPVSDVP